MDTEKIYKWNFKEFFSSDEEFLQMFEKVKSQIKDLDSSFLDLTLEEKLRNFYNFSLEIERLLTYAELNSDLDLTNDKYLNYKNQVYLEKGKLDFFKKIINEEILNIDISLDEYIKKYPNLKPFYMHLYNVLRLKEHEIINSVITNENALISKVNSLYNTLMNLEMPLEEINIDDSILKVNGSIYNQYIKNPDPNLRERVYKTFMKSLKNINKSVSALFNMRYQMCYDIAHEKCYNSILEQVVKEDDLDMKIIDNLLDSVHENFDVLKRYLELKKKRLGISQLHYYDLNVNYEYNPKYSFQEGLEIVKKSLSKLGDEYLNILNKIIDGGMLDISPSKNKFKGGYHFRNYIKPMILMNYKENFREIPTIGHELGHAVNGILIKNNQEYQNFHFSIFLSEIASTVNEDRVENYLYKNANEKDKIVHLEQIVDKAFTSIFFQTLLLEFQKKLCDKIEKGESVSADDINQTFFNIFKLYYEDLEIDEDIKYLWQTRIHLFYDVHRYYNFQYAIGKIVALVINKNIDDGNTKDYLNFLTLGGSKPTLEALNIAGIDLTKKDIFNNAMKYLNTILDDYEDLLNNI